MQGLHLTADLYGCRCAPSLLTDARRLADLCRGAVAASALTVVDEKFFTFPDWKGQPGGVTGAVLLAESHLAIHTWPERDGVTLDVYVCNFSADNSDRAHALFADVIAAFGPGALETKEVVRGRLHSKKRWRPLACKRASPSAVGGSAENRPLIPTAGNAYE